jgi:hypothetical protein
LVTATYDRIADVQPRQRLAVCGEVTRMVYRRSDVVPSLAVGVNDGSGTITAVFMGRRSLGGVAMGRRIVVEGVAIPAGDHLEVLNPLYTLLPR